MYTYIYIYAHTYYICMYIYICRVILHYIILTIMWCDEFWQLSSQAIVLLICARSDTIA